MQKGNGVVLGMYIAVDTIMVKDLLPHGLSKDTATPTQIMVAKIAVQALCLCVAYHTVENEFASVYETLKKKQAADKFTSSINMLEVMTALNRNVQGQSVLCFAVLQLHCDFL
jgi:hypothetical protein